MSDVNFLLLDDNYLIRKSLKALIMTIPEFNVIGDYPEGKDILSFMKKETVDVIFMNINEKEMIDFEITTSIKEACPDVKIIGFSFIDDYPSIEKLVNNGVGGFISKYEITREVIISEIRRVMRLQ
ncbi:response regulator [bacterium]|nr:response regulator [bacterium]